MSLTSLFDKPDTGAGVILLILLFGAMPAVFLTVLMERWTELQSMPTWAYILLGIVLPPMANTEINSLLLYADSVYYNGYHINNLWDV